MKVNIIGKGTIPGVNMLAPAYNLDLSKEQIKRLLNFSEFRVYGADGSGLITKKSLDRVYTVSNTVERISPVVPNKVSKKIVKEFPVDDIKEYRGIVCDENKTDDPKIPNTLSEAYDAYADGIVDKTEETGTTEDIMEINHVIEGFIEEPVVTEEPTEESETVEKAVTTESVTEEETKPIHRNNYNKNKKKKNHNKG